MDYPFHRKNICSMFQTYRYVAHVNEELDLLSTQGTQLYIIHLYKRDNSIRRIYDKSLMNKLVNS